jgi:hypothetical protein
MGLNGARSFPCRGYRQTDVIFLLCEIRSGPHVLSTEQSARPPPLHAQRLDEESPFGDGLEATRAAVEHLGYVQIDTWTCDACSNNR